MAAIRMNQEGDDAVSEEDRALEKAVAALTIHNKKRWHGGKGKGGQGDSKSGDQGQRFFCKRNQRFGRWPFTVTTPRHVPGRGLSKTWQ